MAAAERALVEKHGWMPPKARRAYEEANRPPTVDEYAEGWLSSRDLKPRTKALYAGLLEKHISPSLGSRELPAITPTVVRQWYTAIGPNRPTQRAHAYSLLRSILATAYGEQIIPANPVRHPRCRYR